MWFSIVHKFEDQIDPASPAYLQSKAVGAYTEGDHGVAGISRHDLLATPVKLSNAPAVPRAPAPHFGQHTTQILGELGLGEQEVKRLLEQGVAGVSKGVRKSRKK